MKQAHQEHDSKKRANIVAKVRLLLLRSLKLKSHFASNEFDDGKTNGQVQPIVP